MNQVKTQEEAARYLYNEFYLGQVRLSVLKNVNALRIADLLKEGEVDIQDLAISTNSHLQSLHRIMVTASQMGIFNMRGTKFSLTTLSKAMATDSSLSMSGLLDFTFEDYMSQSLCNLDYTIKTGNPSFVSFNGKTFYEHLKENDKQGRTFNSAMVCIDNTVSPLLATEYDWSGTESLVDLGGGLGNSVLQVLKHNSNILSATVLDVQEVVNKALNQVKECASPNVLSRLKFEVGDIFDIFTIPEADTYMLKNIIHDWNDEECDMLLRNIAILMKGNAKKRLLVVEKIVQVDKQQPHKAGHDIIKLVFFNEHVAHRSIENFKSMFSRNGFAVTRVLALKDTDYYVIEGRLN